MSDGLVAFLRDCLDEDQREAVPNTVASSGGDPGPTVYTCLMGNIRGLPGEPCPWRLDVTDWDRAARDGAAAAHSRTHAGRPLAEVEAKRAVVDHAEYWFTTLRQTPEGWTGEACTAYRMAMEWTLRRLAAPYADRPGYQQEWRP